MTRWGIVAVLVLAAACGEKKDDGKSTEAAKGSGKAKPPGLRVTNLDPASGPIEGGTKVSITGSFGAGPARVYFGAAVAKVIRFAADEIIVETPSSERGIADVVIVLESGGEVTLPGAFMFDDPMAGVE